MESPTTIKLDQHTIAYAEYGALEGYPIFVFRRSCLPAAGTPSHFIRLKPSTMHCWCFSKEKLR